MHDSNFKSSGPQNNRTKDGEINEFSLQSRKEIEIDNSCSDTDNSLDGFEQELIKRDDRIKFLEKELSKMNQNDNRLQAFIDKMVATISSYFKFEPQNNQAKDDEINPQSRREIEFERYNSLDVIKQELTKRDGRIRILGEELSKEKEKNNKLNRSFQNLEDELSKEKQNSKEYRKQMEEDYNQKLRSSEEKANNYQRNLDELRKRYDELKMAKENMKKNMEINIDNLGQQLKDQERNFTQEFKRIQENHKKNINTIRQKLDEKGNGLRELKDENAKLREEASKYQSALGVATNIRLDDNDQNHPVKLKQDILKLQNTLENYVTHLKPNIDLNIKQIQDLAQKYGCLNRIVEQNPNKLFIKAILQREVLDVVHKLSHELINYQSGDFTLESDIGSKADELLRLINIFSTSRAGTDDVTNASIIKIRQQVYGILGNRGFNNIIDFDGSVRMHNFIRYASDELNKLMNQYRKIKDVSREQQVEAMAPKLIHDIFKLFWFRFKVQEPITEFYFPNNDKIDPNTMKGTWNDDKSDQLCVDICYFPLIGQNLNSSNIKVFTLAKVFPRNIRSSDETTEEADK